MSHSLRFLATCGVTVFIVTSLRAQAPAARNSHVMASAGPAGGVLLFGGAANSAPQLVDTLWEWTGTEWRVSSDAGPRSRNMAAAAFDTRRRVMVLYGGSGIGSGTKFGDTWEWDGRRWEEKNVRTPGPRDHHAMAYDEARGKVVAFGGTTRGTWTWDGAMWTMADSTTGPPPLAHHAMVYDSRRQRLVMYGGFPTTGGPRQSDTWEWDGAQWHRVEINQSPGPLSHHRMAYDAARGVTVLFGGGDSTSTDTWTYDGQAWTRHRVSGPPARWSPAMAYDAARARVVLFGGGRSGRPFGSLNDTWEWDGAKWERRQ
jgi:hypothetical protein